MITTMKLNIPFMVLLLGFIGSALLGTNYYHKYTTTVEKQQEYKHLTDSIYVDQAKHILVLEDSITKLNEQPFTTPLTLEAEWNNLTWKNKFLWAEKQLNKAENEIEELDAIAFRLLKERDSLRILTQ